MQDIFGGPGSGSNFGLWIDGGTPGTAAGAGSTIFVSAGSMGTLNGEIGIEVESGTILSGNSNMILVGQGGPGTVADYGVQITASSIIRAINGKITMTGTAINTGGPITSIIRGLVDHDDRQWHHHFFLSTFTITSATDAFLGGNIFANNATFNPPVIITADVIVDTTVPASGNIVFNNTIDGDFNLTLNAGAVSGTVTLAQTVGGTTPIRTLTVTGTGLNLGNDIYTNNSPLIFSIPITLIGNARLSTNNGTNGGAVGGPITFNIPVNGAFALTLDAGPGVTGAITFNALIGNTTPLTALNMIEGTSVTATSAITAGTITQTCISGLSNFMGL